MTLLYWLDKPPDHPLHKTAKDLGFTRSGWWPPREYRQRGTDIINPGAISAAYDYLNMALPPGIPLVINLEGYRRIIAGDYDWLQVHRSVGLSMRPRFVNRLIGDWGLRYGEDHWLNNLYAQDYTCGVISLYRWQGHNDLGWRKHVRQRYIQTASIGKPIQLDMAPVLWSREGKQRLNAMPMTVNQWEQVIKLASVLKPRWFGYWCNRHEAERGFTDEFHAQSMAAMVEGLG